MPLTSRMIAERRSDSFHVSQSPPGWVVRGYGQESYSGETVTVEGALSVASVLSAFTILMEDTASLPLITYRRLTRGKERDVNSPYYILLHDMPNPEHTSMVYREFIMGHLLGWGNHFSQKIWDRRGVLRELWPLRPDRMVVSRKNGQRQYTYTELNGNKRVFRQEDIWHIPAFGFDGLIGYSRITLARNAIGLAIAAEKFGGSFYKNGANFDIVIKHPGELSDDAYDHLQESVDKKHVGVENSHKPMILEEGMSIEKIGIPPDDAQFIETRRFQLGEIARMFRVPPHMMGDVERTTSWGSGIEQQELGYLSHTLRPWLKRIEQGAHKDLLLESERKDTVIEHLVEDFLRTDIGARMTAYVAAITNGIFTRNEVRERENLIPIDGLDRMLMPLNMTTVDGVEKKPVNTKTNRSDFDPRPFILDAAQRAVRRETKELSDAAKRWIEKDKPEKFSAWLEQFYKADHREFLRRTFNPVMDVRVEQLIVDYCELHGEVILGAVSGEEDLESLMRAWSENIPLELTEAILMENDDD
jgi:HK97 family phage portal protein